MSKIKIGMISAFFATMKGGGEHYVLNLSNKLADLGYHVKIICGKEPFKKPEPISNRFELVYVPQLFSLGKLRMKGMKGIGFCTAIIYHYHYVFSCYRYLNKHIQDFDILHTNDIMSLQAAVKVKKRYGCPIVSTYHRFPNYWEKNIIKYADVIITVNEEIKLAFEKFGIANVKVIPGGVDCSVFKSLNKKKCKELLKLDGTVILFVGRLIPLKNIDNLLHAFKKITSTIKDSILLIVGKGVLERDLLRTTLKLGLSEKVRFIGEVSYPELPIYYNAADIFVLPSTYECFPLTSLEAAACSLPIVISTGAEAFIKEFGKENLYITNHEEPKSIYEAIINALTDDEISTKINVCLEKAQTHNWTEKAKQVVELYDLCLENRKKNDI
jgi:glycosyltransferase involved in cell wall biosynthesis